MVNLKVITKKLCVLLWYIPDVLTIILCSLDCNPYEVTYDVQSIKRILPSIDCVSMATQSIIPWALYLVSMTTSFLFWLIEMTCPCLLQGAVNEHYIITWGDLHLCWKIFKLRRPLNVRARSFILSFAQQYNKYNLLIDCLAFFKD